jgi:hypothetical protein
MKLTGHKTRSVFDRYNISSLEDHREAPTRLGQASGIVPGKKAARGQVRQMSRSAKRKIS